MKKIIVFGTNDFAELADFYLNRKYHVAAFTANEAYIKNNVFRGRPVVPFESVEKIFPPREYSFFAPLASNRLRKTVYDQAKAKGYEFVSYISDRATVFSDKIGENCFIQENNTVQPFVEIGNNVILWAGNHIGHHSVIKDHVFFSSHVVLSGHCVVEPYAWFGVNSTIRDGITIAEGSLIAMGSCVTKNTDPWSVYMGTPAKKTEGKDSHNLL